MIKWAFYTFGHLHLFSFKTPIFNRGGVNKLKKSKQFLDTYKMPYDKMNDYITSLFHLFIVVNKKQNPRQKMIGLTIYNYAKYLAYEHNMDLKQIKECDGPINLIPIFEYIAVQNVELIDFSTVKESDIDITKKEDLERFVLSHVYYLTQK
jgi:hypothetical protein